MNLVRRISEIGSCFVFDDLKFSGVVGPDGPALLVERPGRAADMFGLAVQDGMPERFVNRAICGMVFEAIIRVMNIPLASAQSALHSRKDLINFNRLAELGIEIDFDPSVTIHGFHFPPDSGQNN
jgi:hypothetical protein